jgi:hypothetical protein
MPEYDDDTLERIMREGLEFRAGSAATALADPPGSDPHVVRRGRWIAVAAAASVVVAGGVTFAVLHGSGSDGRQVAVDAGPVPSDWRYESYDGVQVRVPPTWGWGGAPTSPTDGEVFGCGSNVAFVVPGSDTYESADAKTPFVGRPAMMTDACQGGVGMQPAVDAVWLGSVLPVGTDTAGPVPAETIALGGQHVTAFGDDAALRAEILATAEAVSTDGNGCPADPQREASPGPADGAQPASLSVCVYDGGHLLWSTTEDQQHAQDYVDAFSQASATYDAASSCTTSPSGQWVAVGVHDSDANAPLRWDIANFDCGTLVGTYTYGQQGKQSPMEAPLIPATVEPWAGGGIKAYVAGPGASDADDLTTYFRGILG